MQGLVQLTIVNCQFDASDEATHRQLFVPGTAHETSPFAQALRAVPGKLCSGCFTADAAKNHHIATADDRLW